MNRFADWLAERPFTLALSSQFFGFYAHAGVVTAFEERGLRPAKLSGSSAGAIVAAAWGSGLRAKEIAELVFAVKREDFWDPSPGFGFLRGRKFEEVLGRHVRPTFAELEIPVEVAVFDLLRWRTGFLREGALPRSVVASCAVPLMFHPVRIGRSLYLDGGVFLKHGARFDDDRERVLCVYLESNGWSGVYERRSDPERRVRTSEHRLLRLTGLPAVSPRRLDSGREAFAAALAATRNALERPLSERSSI